MAAEKRFSSCSAENNPNKRFKTLLSFFPNTSSGKTSVSHSGASLSADPIDKTVPTSPSDIDVTTTSRTTCSSSSTSSDGNAEKSRRSERLFQTKWLSTYPWLTFMSDKNLMTCSVCRKHNKSNSMTDGSSNFRTSTLTRHADCKDHQVAMCAENMKSDFAQAMHNVMSEKENAVVVGLKSVFWLAQENIPMHKYTSLMGLLSDNGCPHLHSLSHSNNASYTSETMANDMLESLAATIRTDIDSRLIRSPFLSVFADESTDLGMQKKIVIYARVVDPETFVPSTHLLENSRITSGTGEAVSQAIFDCLDKRNVPMSSVMGLGSDGAKTMTGTGEGVTGHMLRQNPMLLNIHCIAHRLALVSSQAAKSVPYLKDYQDTLTGLFYFFKGSSNRCDRLTDIQSLLEEPQIKIKEVHDVRWMSIYLAVETIYKSLDSLISVFVNDKDAKAKGFGKKLSNTDFISVTYMLMDVLPIISELCLVFQKTDLDVSLVEVSIDQCVHDLERCKSGQPRVGATQTYLQQLEDHLCVVDGVLMFKGNHVISKGARNIQKIKETFIDSLIEKLDERFPKKDTNLMFAFGVLAMRPVSFLTKQQLQDWGNKQIELLIHHYGQEQSHEHRGHTSFAQSIIDPEATRREWAKVKPLVCNEGYPRDKLCVLWRLVSENYKDEFPNLCKLAVLALTAPIHTADCERGFSGQNLIKTGVRNRLSPERLDDLLMVSSEGGDRSNFCFRDAFNQWKNKKDRRLFAT